MWSNSRAYILSIGFAPEKLIVSKCNDTIFKICFVLDKTFNFYEKVLTVGFCVTKFRLKVRNGGEGVDFSTKN